MKRIIFASLILIFALPLAAIDSVAATMEGVPLFFIENRGQIGSGIDYYILGKDKSLYFDSQGATFSLLERSQERGLLEDLLSDLKGDDFGTGGYRWNVRIDFVDADSEAIVVGEDPTPAMINYFKGSRSDWKTGLKTYSSLRYRNLWKGIDLIYSGKEDRIEYRFVVQPGADPEKIRLAYDGAEKVLENDEGELAIETPVGDIKEGDLYVYQEKRGERMKVAANFIVEKQTEKYVVGFKLGAYDRQRPLIIDPATLIYAGFIGGSNEDAGYGIAVDGSGNAYVTGHTESTEATFPDMVGPDTTYNGGLSETLGGGDAFVAKIASDGRSFLYVGFIGGSGDEFGNDIAVDGSGNAYVTGTTDSTEASFPVTAGPDLTFNGNSGAYGWGGDAFVAKVHADGSSLAYAGFIGGSGHDYGNGIAVDEAGNAYVTGTTASIVTPLPVTVGPDLSFNGGSDAFVAKVNPDGGSLVYAGFIGREGVDTGDDIAVDRNGNVYVTGTTWSDDSTTSFPVTVGPDLSGIWGNDAFVAKVNADGSSLAYAGFIGDSGHDYGNAIAVDEAGNAYVTGTTSPSATSFPVTVGPDLTFNGDSDAFVAKVTADGGSFDYVGFIGGSGFDSGQGIAVDRSGNAYVTGTTVPVDGTFPVMNGPDTTSNGSHEAYVAKIRADGSSLVYAGFVGGSGHDYGYGIAVDEAGNAYVTGATSSDEETFPEKAGPDTSFNGGRDSFGGGDAFVTKVAFVVRCRDGIVEEGEQCDDGNRVNNDSCSNACLFPRCGDSIIQYRRGEECDPPNHIGSIWLCTSKCKSSTLPGSSNIPRRGR